MARKPAFKRFKESLTDEQHLLLKQSCEDAERERPEILERLRRFEANMAPVNAEIRSAFQLLKSVRATQKVSLGELSERTGIAKNQLLALENNPEPFLSIEMLANIAHALGHELRISVGSAAAAPAPRRRKAVASA